jgi:hypothetical protein
MRQKSQQPGHGEERRGGYSQSELMARQKL